MKQVSRQSKAAPAGRLLICIWTLLLCISTPGMCNWPSFRGPGASGVADGYPVAEKWDVKAGENVAWKTTVPGLGHSSPIVWGDRIFVTTAVKQAGVASLKVDPNGNSDSVKNEGIISWRLYCIDRETGEILWDKEAYRGEPKIKRHTKSTHANATPCTDGKHVITFFGSEGLYCYDFDGDLMWKRDLGVLNWGYFRSPAAQWGGASSPVIHEQMVIVQCDVQGNSFLAALDIADGSDIWRTARDETPTWGTPAVHAAGHFPQIIVNGYKHIGGYDIDSGAEIWKMAGTGEIPVPTPVLGQGLVFITNTDGGKSPIYAVKLSAKGDISLEKAQTSNDHLAWSYSTGGNDTTTPLFYRDRLYCCSDRGKLSCIDPNTGKLIYRENLAGSSAAFSASPVAANGKVYCTGEKGDIYVVEAGDRFKTPTVNQMDETCMATPAVVEGTLYFRTRAHLIAITARR